MKVDDEEWVEIDERVERLIQIHRLNLIERKRFDDVIE